MHEKIPIQHDASAFIEFAVTPPAKDRVGERLPARVQRLETGYGALELADQRRARNTLSSPANALRKEAGIDTRFFTSTTPSKEE
jgi:hypothetical protein